MSKWKQPSPPSNGQSSESTEPERKPWKKAAATPEERAKEGVQANSPESSLLETNEAHPWNEEGGSYAPTAPAYDYHAHEAYDPYAYNQYDDYYLIDDYYLQDDYYYQDGYYGRNDYAQGPSAVLSAPPENPLMQGATSYVQPASDLGSPEQNLVTQGMLQEPAVLQEWQTRTNEGLHAVFQPVETSYPTFVPPETTFGTAYSEPTAETNREGYASSFLRDEHYTADTARASLEPVTPTTYIEAGAAISLTSDRSAEGILNPSASESPATHSAHSAYNAVSEQLVSDYPLMEPFAYEDGPTGSLPASEPFLTGSFVDGSARGFGTEYIAQAQAHTPSHEVAFLQEPALSSAHSSLVGEQSANRLTVNRISDEPYYAAENPLTTNPYIPVLEEGSPYQTATESLFSVPTQDQVSDVSAMQASVLQKGNGVPAWSVEASIDTVKEPQIDANGHVPTLLRDSRSEPIPQESVYGQEDHLSPLLFSHTASEGPEHTDEHISIESFLVDPNERLHQAESFLMEHEVQPKNADALNLIEETGAASSVLIRTSQTEHDGKPIDGSGHHEKGSGRHGKGNHVATVAGATALDALEMAEHVAGQALEGAVGAAGMLANQAMREDEDLARVATAQDTLMEAADKARHATSSGIRFELLNDVRLEGGELSGRNAAAEKGLVDSAKHAKTESAEDVLSPMSGRHALLQEDDSAAISGKHAKASLCADMEDDEGVEALLMPEKGDEKLQNAKHKRPVTKRERELAEKARKAKKLRQDKDSKGVSMSVVKSGKNMGKKGAVFVGTMGLSSVKKAISSEDEDIATVMTLAGKTKQGVRGVRRIAGVPVKLYRVTRRIVHGIAFAAKAVIGTVGSMGAAFLVPLLIVFVLLAALLLILLATASIINEDQEVADISALVAQLDEDLTEEIHEAGSQPILYAKANDTYLEKGENGKKLTMDVDMSDEDYDLEEVVASSVTVQTNPAEIAAYIDAKYSGKWQVKAASWKYTIDAFGKTWTVFEWDQVPEWVRKALNRVDRSQFVYKVSAGLSIPMIAELDIDKTAALDITTDIAKEMAVIVYENQLQEANEEVVTQVIEDAFKEHESDLDLSEDDKKKLYYYMLDVITGIAGEEEPVALVYDEIVDLHAKMNYWSEDYESLLARSSGGTFVASGMGGESGGSNKYGYPNTSGYSADELAKWDGYNEISVYGISEAGTTSTLGDGTKITNTWADTNLAIACEGLQLETFAYWTQAYKEATGLSDPTPVKITLYNPSTGKSVTAEVRDCGGWRGYNSQYAGLNADRQWDVLPAVWKALGGGEVAGCMNVYWKVDPDAVVGGGNVEPVDIDDYPWPKETDDGTLTVSRATYVSHGVQDVLRNKSLMDELIDSESYATEKEAEEVRNMVTTKVQDVMKTLLTMTNVNEDTYVDYTYLRRNLGNPFGEDKDGNPVQWVIVERYNPGFDDFEHDDAYVAIKPLTKNKTVYAISKGTVESVEDGKVTVMLNLDTTTNDKVEYYNLKDVQVEENDEIKTGTKLGTMADDVLHVKHYETDKSQLIMEIDRDWAYDPGLYMQGFAGYEEPEAPTAYTGGGGAGSSLEGCSTVVEYAYSRLGCPYVWGATGPSTFDCSGLTQWCYAKAGITIPRNSEWQQEAAAVAGNAHPVSDGGMQPGDILWKPGHVGIYIGGDQYIHAPQPGDVVKVSTGILGMWQQYLRFG